MIEATRIETPEVERPDLYTMVQFIPNAPADSVCATMSSCREPWPTRPGWTSFRLPGTRREKLTKEREKLIADVVAAVRDWDANHNVSGMAVINPARRLADFDAALLALDAEGVKG